jgi:NADH-quinone oxidoreductase subunit J
MNIVFYISAIVAIVATVLAISGIRAVHALLYLNVSLLAEALVLFALGAPFMAALEVIIYAGAIIVLIVVVVMMFNLGPEAAEQERQWLKPGIWIVPSILMLILAGELVYVFAKGESLKLAAVRSIGPKAVGLALFGPYGVAVELASMLLLAGLVGAYHLGRRNGEPS